MRNKHHALRKVLLTSLVLMLLVAFMPVRAYADEAFQIGIDGYKAEDGNLKIYVNQNQGSSFNITPEQTEVMLGNNTLTTQEIRTFGEAGEPVTYLCVIDVSGSMSQDRIDKAAEVIKNLADKKKAEDKIAITTMGNELNQSAYMTDPEEIKKLADSIKVTREDTNLYYAVVEEINALKASDDAKGKRCLVIFSDGADDQATGVTQGEAETAVTGSHIPVFTVGLLKNAKSTSDQEMAKILGSFARISSGGMHFAPALGDGEIETIADSIIDRINSSFVLYEGLGDVNISGKEVALKTTISTQDGQSATDTLTLPDSDVKSIQEYIESLAPAEPEVPAFDISITQVATEDGKLVVSVNHNKDASVFDSIQNVEVKLGDTLLGNVDKKLSEEDGETILLYEEVEDLSLLDNETTLYASISALGETAVDTIRLSAEDASTLKGTLGKLIFGLKPMYFYALCGLLAVLLALVVLLIVKNSKKDEIAEEEPQDEFSEEEGENTYDDNVPTQGSPSFNNESVTIPGEALNNQGASVTMPITSATPADSSSLNVLFVRMGKGEEKSFKATVSGNPCKIGRSATQSKMAMTDDTALSSVHCSLSTKGNRLFIKDEKSTNGTFVNGVPISGQFELSQDDIVLIGSYEYRVSWK